MSYDRELWASLFSAAQAMPTNRILLCLKPPSETAGLVTDLAMGLWRSAGSPRSPIRQRQLHVSVCGLGDHYDFPKRLCGKVIDLLDRASLPPFQIGFDRFVRFGGKAAVLRDATQNPEATWLGRNICALVQQTLSPPFRYRHAFDPHMTIFYGGRSFAETTVDRIEWTANEMVLVHSLLGQARHEIIARWPLCGAATAFPAKSAPIQLDLFGQEKGHQI